MYDSDEGATVPLLGLLLSLYRIPPPPPFATPATPNAPDPIGTGARDSFRHHLRHATMPEHEAVEAAFAPLTADLAATLPVFLTAQRHAFRLLLDACPPGAALISDGTIKDLMDRLDRDLGPASQTPAAPPRLEPLAVDYLVLGSRLGTEVLRRDMQTRAPDVPLPAYFQAPPVSAEWRRLCAELDAVAPDGAEAARIEFDVRRGFGIFSSAALASRDDLCGMEA